MPPGCVLHFSLHKVASFPLTYLCFKPKYSDLMYIKASSYITQYPVRTQDCSKHFTLYFPDRPVHSDTRLLWEASSHMLQLMHEGCSYTYPPLSIVKYSFIQLSELEQCRGEKLAQDFNTAAQDSNPGSCSWESKALLLRPEPFRSSGILTLITPTGAVVAW